EQEKSQSLEGSEAQTQAPSEDAICEGTSTDNPTDNTDQPNTAEQEATENNTAPEEQEKSQSLEGSEAQTQAPGEDAVCEGTATENPTDNIDGPYASVDRKNGGVTVSVGVISDEQDNIQIDAINVTASIGNYGEQGGIRNGMAIEAQLIRIEGTFQSETGSYINLEGGVNTVNFEKSSGVDYLGGTLSANFDVIGGSTTFGVSNPEKAWDVSATLGGGFGVGGGVEGYLGRDIDLDNNPEVGFNVDISAVLKVEFGLSIEMPSFDD
ncbi:MAG: hypothetical protein SAJ12_20980, partial [Jaaginema sp. PMC 1079.18]|nr:hypothetical protein [Jaaginema sp. PMC 1079.18]MEC4868598.1 hypothetical protein [Jaaginema sp. PMC 1078.18]